MNNSNAVCNTNEAAQVQNLVANTVRGNARLGTVSGFLLVVLGLLVSVPVETGDVLVFDGGNNDQPMIRPDVQVVVLDPHRGPGFCSLAHQAARLRPRPATVPDQAPLSALRLRYQAAEAPTSTTTASTATKTPVRIVVI